MVYGGKCICSKMLSNVIELSLVLCILNYFTKVTFSQTCYNGNCYTISTNSVKYNQAVCSTGNILEVTSSQIQNDIEVIVNAEPYAVYWIGLTDQASETNFVWKSGAAFTYSNFVSTNKNTNGKDCVRLSSSNGWEWISVPCSNKAIYICVTEGESTTIQAETTTQPGTTIQTEITTMADTSTAISSTTQPKTTITTTAQPETTIQTEITTLTDTTILTAPTTQANSTITTVATTQPGTTIQTEITTMADTSTARSSTTQPKTTITTTAQPEATIQTEITTLADTTILTAPTTQANSTITTVATMQTETTIQTETEQTDTTTQTETTTKPNTTMHTEATTRLQAETTIASMTNTQTDQSEIPRSTQSKTGASVCNEQNDKIVYNVTEDMTISPGLRNLFHELSEQTERINTNRKKRKNTSASDDRPLSKVFGYMGIAILFMVGTVLFLMDISNLRRALKTMKVNVCGV